MRNTVKVVVLFSNLFNSIEYSRFIVIILGIINLNPFTIFNLLNKFISLTFSCLLNFTIFTCT